MTADELRTKLNSFTFTLDNFPKTYEVDMETYGYCLDSIINHHFDRGLYNEIQGTDLIELCIMIGPNRGLKFKGIELIPVKKNG